MRCPLIPVGLCQLTLHNLDRRLLLNLTPEGDPWEAAGVYGLAYKIGFLVTTMLLAPFLQIWHPWIFGIEDERVRAQHVARVGTWAVLAIGLASLTVILFGRQATWILDGSGDFFEAYRVIPWIAGAYVFWALYRVSELPLLIAKRTGRLFAINLGAVVGNVLLNVLLIPRLGFLGAGIATALTLAGLALGGMLVSRRVAGVRFELGRLATVLVVVVLGGGLALGVGRGRALGSHRPGAGRRPEGWSAGTPRRGTPGDDPLARGTRTTARLDRASRSPPVDSDPRGSNQIGSRRKRYHRHPPSTITCSGSPLRIRERLSDQLVEPRPGS